MSKEFKSNSNSKKRKRASKSLRIASRRAFSLVHNALKKRGWTQYALISEVGVSKTTIDSFFAGRGIARDTFIVICKTLDLSPEDIYEPEQVIEVPRAPVSYYSGKQRTEQMNDLVIQQEKSNGIIISIPDMGGQGKTEFVLKFVEDKIKQNKTKFSGGCVFIDANQNIFQQINRFFRKLAEANPTYPDWKEPPSSNEDPEKVQDWYNEYKTKYPTKPFPVLLIFDNVESLSKIKGYLPTQYSDHFGVLITTRKQTLALSYDVFYIDPFTEKDSIELFSRIIKPNWIIDECREEFNELAFLVGYLPLAIEMESKLIKTRIVGRRVVDKPDFIPATKQKLADLIETLKHPCEIPASLKSIGAGLGLTTELNTDPTRRRELKENGIVALFLYTWKLFTQEVAQVAYAASLFDTSPVDIECLTNWLSSSLEKQVEEIIFDELAEYSFCKINNHDEIEIHKLIKKFILEQRSDIKKVEKVERSITLGLVSDIGTFTNEKFVFKHRADISSERLEEYFCRNTPEIDPWKYVLDKQEIIEEALIKRLLYNYEDIDRVRKIEIFSKHMYLRIRKESDPIKLAYLCLNLNLVLSVTGRFKECFQILCIATSEMEKADVKDYPLSISILEQAGQALSSHAEGLSVTSGNYYYSVLELAYSYYNAALNVAYLTGRKEESEVVRSLYNKRALTLLQLGKGDKALKDAEKILNAIYRMQQHGKDVKIQDVGIVGFIYLATGRFAEARKLFRTLLSGKDNTSTVGDRLLFIADTYKLAGINSQVREYLSLARRYYQIGIREHQKTLGRNNPLCLRAVSELNEVDKLISTTDKQTIENKIDI